MKQIKRFMLLGLTIACLLITTTSFAQTPLPSWKFESDDYAGHGLDSGIFYCITTDPSQYPCAICGTLDASEYDHYWIHLENLFGLEMASDGRDIINQIDIVIKGLNAVTDMASARPNILQSAIL